MWKLFMHACSLATDFKFNSSTFDFKMFCSLPYAYMEPSKQFDANSSGCFCFDFFFQFSPTCYKPSSLECNPNIDVQMALLDMEGRS
jgi:hypothetical protein